MLPCQIHPVSVPVFDIKAVILSMLHDTRRMQSSNFASAYDIFTGICTKDENNYLDEIHTGALWSIACDHYCHDNENAFPLALLCFYDKTHTDLHGALSCAPFIATFSFFNEAARGKDDFYAILGYIPNLSYGSGKSSTKEARDKLNDEHLCLRLITDQILELSQGFDTVVLGRSVTIKPWIHFIAGGTSGHNNLVGQYNSSQAFPYRDCSCLLAQMSDPIAQCKLITVLDFSTTKLCNKLADLSLHNIDNAFHDILFGDLVHGIFGCVPAKCFMLVVTVPCNTNWKLSTRLYRRVRTNEKIYTVLTYSTRSLSRTHLFRANRIYPGHWIVME